MAAGNNILLIGTENGFALRWNVDSETNNLEGSSFRQQLLFFLFFVLRTTQDYQTQFIDVSKAIILDNLLY